MKKPARKFSDITSYSMPDRAMEDGYSAEDEARDVGRAVLANWVWVARWYWGDGEVAGLLEAEAGRLREYDTAEVK